MGSDEFMQDRDPADPFGHPACRQLDASLIAHVHVVMGLGPIITNKDHLLLSFAQVP
jgi:hypothetical protein